MEYYDFRVQAMRDFSHRMKCFYEGPPRILPRDLAMFRLRFMGEELREIGEVMGIKVTVTCEYVGVPDGPGDMEILEGTILELIDLDYLIIGTIDLMGVGSIYPHSWARVHAANMTKEPIEPQTAATKWGVQKPPDFQPPQLWDLLEKLV